MSTSQEVNFYANLLQFLEVPCIEISGQEDQESQTSTYKEFVDSDTGVLLITDSAHKGLESVEVDWNIQYDAPHSPEEFIVRAQQSS